MQVNKFFDWVQYWLTKNTKNIKARKPYYCSPDSSVAKIILTIDRSREKQILLTMKDGAVIISKNNHTHRTWAHETKGEITKRIKEYVKDLRS